MTVYFRRHTIGKKLTCTACARGTRVSPGVLACLGSTMAPIKALDHAHGPRLVIFRHDAREANKRRWFVSGLNAPLEVYQACIKYATGGVVSIIDIQTTAQSIGIL